MVAKVPANSRLGRQLTAAKGTSGLVRAGLTPDQIAWNAEVERRKHGREDMLQLPAAGSASRVELAVHLNITNSTTGSHG